MKIKLNYYLLLMFGALITGGNLFGLMFPIVTKLYLVSIIIIWLFSLYRNSNLKIQNLNDMDINIILFCFILFYFILVLSTLLNMSYQSGIYNMIKSLIYFSLFLIIYLLIDSKNIEKMIFFYNRLILLFSYLGVIGFVLIQNNLMPIIASYNIDDRVYNFYFFTTSIERDSILNIGNYSLYRLQSYFDEPGSYAIILIPTIIWYTYYSVNKIHRLTLYLAMILTFSIGGYITLLTVLIYFYFKDRIVNFVFYVLLICFIFVIFYSYIDELLNSSSIIIEFIKYKFGIGSYENEITSGGTRILQFNIFIDTLISNPFGIGFENGIVFSSITPGILRAIMASGMIGLPFMVILNLFILKKSIVYANKGYLFHSALGITFIFQGMQRAAFFESFLGLMLFVLFLKSQSRKNKYVFKSSSN